MVIVTLYKIIKIAHGGHRLDPWSTRGTEMPHAAGHLSQLTASTVRHSYGPCALEPMCHN